MGNIRLGTGAGIADLQRRARAKATPPATPSLHERLINQVVDLLAVGVRTIKRLTVPGKKNGLPHQRIASQLRFRPLAIQRWLVGAEKNGAAP